MSAGCRSRGHFYSGAHRSTPGKRLPSASIRMYWWVDNLTSKAVGPVDRVNHQVPRNVALPRVWPRSEIRISSPRDFSAPIRGLMVIPWLGN
jgi:hypothetical protein